MIVAYLVNQYPHVSHSFIRREIVGVEAAGVSVCRFAIRPPGKDVVDPADIEECSRTRSILSVSKISLVIAGIAMFFRHPVRWVRAFATAWRMGRAANRRLRHLIYLTEACLLVRWLHECHATHLHTHFGTNPAAVALLTRILGGPPYSFTVHGPEEFDRPDALSLREKIAGAEFVVAISSFGRSQLFRWACLEDWSKIRIVRCGVDAAFLEGGPLPISSNTRLVCVGRLAEQKGQLLLITAAARLAAMGHNFELILAGDGPMRPMIEDAIREHGLQDRVRITGWLSNDAVRREIASARVVVLPSFAEGLPVVLMEALAMGRPVVTTYVAGIPELVRGGVNGWLVPAGDLGALVAALTQALEYTPDELETMGIAGSEAVQLAHNAAHEASKLAALFAAPTAPTRDTAIESDPPLAPARVTQ
ncbi:MAG: glycosyltransferase family 4 protein [Planctomycetes bacterium]|nr:glycosyltransferase family 4 protein [Planctomycetota bacterium]